AQQLYDKISGDMDYIKEKVTRLDEKVTGGNGGGLCKQVENHESEIDRRVTRNEFRWTIGGLTAIIITGLTVIGWFVI
ncbi:MAG: hypothetical protein U9Q17_03100, partial [Chloroflexota bacterium]|nr:hypothetical protein [Chloroflexota bacterium]